MDSRQQNDFEHYFEYFIDQLTGEGKEFNETFYRKVFFKTTQETRRDLEDVIDNFRRNLEQNLDVYKQQIAGEMAEEFCKYYWEKFEDGHDWYEGMKAICYFKETDKYFIGTAITMDDGDTKFLLESGKYESPDYVAALYEFKEK